MTDYLNSARRPVRTIRWKCPECGTMGDTKDKSNRRFSIIRLWCSDECREGSEVRRTLQREYKERTRTLDFYKPVKVDTMQSLPPVKGPALDCHKHWIRTGPGPSPEAMARAETAFANDPRHAHVLRASSSDYGPFKRIKGQL